MTQDPEVKPPGEASDPTRLSRLCRPDEQTACFACCPPIRPSGYDHADHEASVRRELLENTRALRDQGPRERPITGMSCWGLGFLDQKGRMAGCLLHPARNQGRDLRDLTGYGEKCRRELCREAVALAELPPTLADFVLRLGQGLDSFAYSSPRKNPVFQLLAWGPDMIERLAASAGGSLDRETYFERYAFLAWDLDPGPNAFPLLLFLGDRDLEEGGRPDFLARYQAGLAAFVARHRLAVTLPLDRRPFLHELGLPSTLTAFFREALGWTRALPSQAEEIRVALTQAMETLRRE